MVGIHPEREDLYAALRPLLADHPRQDRTFLDQIDQLQPSLRTACLCDSEDLNILNAEDSATAWFIPSVAHLLPDLEPFDVDGLTVHTLELALQRSPFGLRLVGYPILSLRELMDSPAPPSPLAETSSRNAPAPQTDNGVIEALPEWQNPDGEALLAAALRQEEGRPARDPEGLQVKPIFGHSGIEQGLALLQMICETLRLPRRDVIDRMLKGMVGNKPSPVWRTLARSPMVLGLTQC